MTRPTPVIGFARYSHRTDSRHRRKRVHDRCQQEPELQGSGTISFTSRANTFIALAKRRDPDRQAELDEHEQREPDRGDREMLTGKEQVREEHADGDPEVDEGRADAAQGQR